jgi:hypothetical protein
MQGTTLKFTTCLGPHLVTLVVWPHIFALPFSATGSPFCAPQMSPLPRLPQHLLVQLRSRHLLQQGAQVQRLRYHHHRAQFLEVILCLSNKLKILVKSLQST